MIKIIFFAGVVTIKLFDRLLERVGESQVREYAKSRGSRGSRRSFLCDKLVGHSHGSNSWVILMGQTRGSFLWVKLVNHSRG